MHKPETHKVTLSNGPSPAGPPDRCVHCAQKVGSDHTSKCILRKRTVVLELKLHVVRSVPESWSENDINIYNQGFDNDNLLPYFIYVAGKDGSLSNYELATYLKEATEVDEQAAEAYRKIHNENEAEHSVVLIGEEVLSSTMAIGASKDSLSQEHLDEVIAEAILTINKSGWLHVAYSCAGHSPDELLGRDYHVSKKNYNYSQRVFGETVLYIVPYRAYAEFSCSKFDKDRLFHCLNQAIEDTACPEDYTLGDLTWLYHAENLGYDVRVNRLDNADEWMSFLIRFEEAHDEFTHSLVLKTIHRLAELVAETDNGEMESHQQSINASSQES